MAIHGSSEWLVNMRPTLEFVMLHASRFVSGDTTAGNAWGVTIGSVTLGSDAMQQWLIDNDAGIFDFDETRRNETEVNRVKFAVARGVNLVFTRVVQRSGVVYYSIHSTYFPDQNAILYRNTRCDIRGFIDANDFSVEQFRALMARCVGILEHLHSRGVFYGNTSPTTILLLNNEACADPRMFCPDDVIIGDLQGIRSARGDLSCDKSLLAHEYTYYNPYDNAGDYSCDENDEFMTDVMDAIDTDDMILIWGHCESLDTEEVDRARDWYHFGMGMVEIMRLMYVKGASDILLYEARTVWKAYCLFPRFHVVPQ